MSKLKIIFDGTVMGTQVLCGETHLEQVISRIEIEPITAGSQWKITLTFSCDVSIEMASEIDEIKALNDHQITIN